MTYFPHSQQEINDINISVFVDHIKNSDVIRIITSKLATIESNRILQEKRTGIADYGLRQAVSDLESMRQMIQTNNDRMANLQILVTLWGNTLEELSEKRATYSNLLNEFIANIRLVKSFATERQELDRLEELRKEMGIWGLSLMDILMRLMMA